MILIANVLFIKFLCYSFGLIFPGCSKTAASNMAPCIKSSTSSDSSNHVDKIQRLINRLFTDPSPAVGQGSHQLITDAARIAEKARWNKTLVRYYCNEINGIFEKNVDVSSNQLQSAFRFAIRAIESTLLTAKHTLFFFKQLQPAYEAKHKQRNMLMDSFNIVDEKYCELDQISKDLRYANEDNILHSRFRAYLDHSVNKANHLNKIAYKLFNSCIA